MHERKIYEKLDLAIAFYSLVNKFGLCACLVEQKLESQQLAVGLLTINVGIRPPCRTRQHLGHLARTDNLLTPFA